MEVAMQDVKRWRESWAEVEAFETELIRKMTVEEKVQEYLDLMKETWLWKPEVEADYQAEREIALIELQDRLAQLERYRKGLWTMEEQLDRLNRSLVKLQTHLEAQGIATALIGGLALAAWARPRVTKDADLKLQLSRDEAEKLLAVLEPDYYILQSDPLRALKRNGIIFVKDADGVRMDLMLADTELDRATIQRAKTVQLHNGQMVKVATAEDLILHKMISTRPQDNVDVEQIVRAQGDQLDDTYIIKTLRELEQALADSTLVTTYQRMRRKFP
jgi:hypothetical protein